MKAELVPSNGDPPIPITRDLTIVGRREYCDVQIDYHGLSKRHCVLVKTDGLLVIRDLSTTNGTKVNGQRVRWAALLPNDRLTMGGYKTRVYLGPDDVPSPSEVAARVVSAARPPSGVTITPKRRSTKSKGAPAPAPPATIARNGQNQDAPSGGFAAPSPLATPLVSREILEDDEWATGVDVAEQNPAASAPPTPPSPATPNGDDEVFVMELDD
jgi:predicted component of type VI protein secretion system